MLIRSREKRTEAADWVADAFAEVVLPPLLPLLLVLPPLALALAWAPEAFAPVAAMRASRSAAVVQVMLVPAELTRGSAAQLSCETERRQLQFHAETTNKTLCKIRT